MKTLPSVALVLATSLTVFSAEPPWRALFNDRDLTGWKIVGSSPKAYAAVEQLPADPFAAPLLRAFD